MPQPIATIESPAMALEAVKAMQDDGLEWGEGYRPLGRPALAEIIQGRMAEAVDSWLDSLDCRTVRDRRNGTVTPARARRHERRILASGATLDLSGDSRGCKPGRLPPRPLLHRGSVR